MTPHMAGVTLVVTLLLLCTSLTVAANTVTENSPQQSQTPPATLVGNDGAEMVLVQAGEFIMGSDGDELDRLKASRESFGDEIPRHRVYLDAFYIDKYEVTNARFQRFVQATGHRTQAERDGLESCLHRGKARAGQRCELARAAGSRQQHCQSGAAPGGAGEPGGR